MGVYQGMLTVDIIDGNQWQEVPELLGSDVVRITLPAEIGTFFVWASDNPPTENDKGEKVTNLGKYEMVGGAPTTRYWVRSQRPTTCTVSSSK